MQIINERMAHMHGVAEWMYEHAEEYGCKNKNEILNDFVIEKEVPKELINEYKSRLPEQVIQIWEEYGFGSFMKGFMKTIDPSRFQDITNRAYFMGEHSIPIFATALGDLIIWEQNSYLTILRFRHGIFVIMEKGCNYFLNDLTDHEYVEEFLKPHDYYLALKDQGSISYDECFGYIPLLCLGGSENANQLQKVKLLEYMEMILAIADPMI